MKIVHLTWQMHMGEFIVNIMRIYMEEYDMYHKVSIIHNHMISLSHQTEELLPEIISFHQGCIVWKLYVHHVEL